MTYIHSTFGNNNNGEMSALELLALVKNQDLYQEQIENLSKAQTAAHAAKEAQQVDFNQRAAALALDKENALKEIDAQKKAFDAYVAAQNDALNNAKKEHAKNLALLDKDRQAIAQTRKELADEIAALRAAKEEAQEAQQQAFTDSDEAKAYLQKIHAAYCAFHEQVTQ